MVVVRRIGALSRQGDGHPLLFGAGSVIFLPIFYGILGFVLGLITALLYNLVARLVGGIQIELEETRRPGSATYQP
jgi:hypothetical protein